MEHESSIIFSKNQIERFLKLVDKELRSKATMSIIGGAAAAIAYDAKDGTKDIDTWKTEKELERAIEVVQKNNPSLRLPVSPVTVKIDSPEIYKRMRTETKYDFTNLILKVPDPEDLFLLKAQRANEKDIQDLINLNTNYTLSPSKIFKRFKNDILVYSPENDQLLIDNYLYTIDQVFDTQTAKEHLKQLSV